MYPPLLEIQSGYPTDSLTFRKVKNHPPSKFACMRSTEILIVEDSLTQAEQLLFTLESNGFKVTHKLNGRLALKALDDFSPDLIISDIVMPEMDGYHFCFALKQDTRLKNIPVILLTSLSDPKDVIKGLECGADGFLVKPYSEEFLLSRIAYFIQNAELRKKQEDSSVLEILFADQKFTITSSPRQILDILLSTYEYSIHKNLELNDTNKELSLAQGNLTKLNANLEKEVSLRTRDLENTNAKLVEEIEERKRARIELIAAKERAEESNRLKSALLNNMSHEIRTPMNAIMGFANLLQEAEGSELSMYSEIIQKSSRQLLKLLDDVILLSRLQSEKLALYNYDCIPAEIVQHIHKVFQSTENDKNLAFSMKIPEQHLSTIVRADEDKITQALTNLTSNAFKYTFQGSVEIGFDIKDDQITFFVNDTGIGIPKKELGKIFENFYRGEQAISRAIRGNGLGLNITRELVELMGGAIAVQSEPDKGSQFTFSIPFKTGSQPVSQAHTDEPAESLVPGMEILIAEDELINFSYLEILLRGKVKKVDHARNGQEAIEMIAQNRYDLVLMDMKMPVMGGAEATTIIKNKLPGLKVIAQTAFSLPEEKEMALAAGCDDFIPKPIRGSDLLSLLGKYGKIR